MTVFKYFFKMEKKYVSSFIMYTAIFLGIIILLSVNGKEQETTNFIASGVKIAVFDHDESILSDGLKDYLEENHKIIEINEDMDTFRDKIYNREVAYILTIPQGYEKSVLEGDENVALEVYTLPGSFSAEFMDMAINTFVSTYSGYLVSGFVPEEAYAKTIATNQIEAEVTFTNVNAGKEYNGAHNFYLYLQYALIYVIILSVGPILIVYNKEVIRKRINCSKVSNFKKNLSLVAGCGIYSILIVAIYAVTSIIMFPGDVLNAALGYRILNLLVHTFVCVSLALLFSMLTKTSNLLNMFSNVVGLGSAFLCGIFVPRSMLSDSLNAVGHFLPAYWYVNVEDAVNNLENASMSTITMGYTVQLVYGVAIFVIAMTVSQYRRKR